MTAITVDQQVVDRAVSIHGSLCRGLAIGIQAGRLAREELGAGELVAMAESEHCALDGIQAVTGSTPGNRNLIVKDWGKLAYTFHRRSDGKAIRLAWTAGLNPAYQSMRNKVQAGMATPVETAQFEAIDEAEIARILNAEPSTLFQVVAVEAPVPVTPTVGTWLRCQRCGEEVMETRTRRIDGDTVCIPCFEVAQVAA